MDDQALPEADDISEDLTHLIKPELQPGERLLWASRAGLGPGSNPASTWPSKPALIWFFGFLTASIGCFAAIPMVANRRPDGPEAGLAVLGIFAGIIAFFFAVFFVGNFFSKQKEREKLAGQVYALTDRRAVIWVPAERSAVAVHTFQRGTLKGEQLHRVEYPDGSGDVLFHGGYFGGASGFIGIAEVRRVEELVRRFLVDPTRKAEFADEFAD